MTVAARGRGASGGVAVMATREEMVSLGVEGGGLAGMGARRAAAAVERGRSSATRHPAQRWTRGRRCTYRGSARSICSLIERLRVACSHTGEPPPQRRSYNHPRSWCTRNRGRRRAGAGDRAKAATAGAEMVAPSSPGCSPLAGSTSQNSKPSRLSILGSKRWSRGTPCRRCKWSGCIAGRGSQV